MTLRTFISSSAHMTERERLLHLTAAQQLRLHAARFDARLMITEPDIDNEGFDFTISSEFESLFVQSKGTLSKGGARSWRVRAALIKPSFYNRDLMPNLDNAILGGYSTGATGGVLLHVIDEEAADADRWEVSYRYLDIFWLIAVSSGVACRSEKERERALELLRAIRSADDEQRIELKFADFAKLKSVAALATLRLHIGAMSNWASTCHLGEDLALPPSQREGIKLLWHNVHHLLD